MPSGELPFDPTSTKQTYTIDLDEIELELRVEYLERASSWYVSIYAPDGTLLQGARRLDANWLVTGEAPIEGLPPGVIISPTTLERLLPIRLRELGNTAFLYYVSPDDYTPPADETDGYVLRVEATP